MIVKSTLFITLILFGIHGMCQVKIDRLDSLIDHYYPDNSVPGISLNIRNGENYPSIYRGRGITNFDTQKQIQENTCFRLASVSKQFTAFSIFKLIEQSKLSMTDPVSMFLPELTGGAGRITIGELINHTSGIKDYEEIIPATQTVQLSDADVLKLVAPFQNAFYSEARRFSYSNTAYCLMTIILERLTGKTYASFMQENVFEPLGMKQAIILEENKDFAQRAFGYSKRGEQFAFADQSLTSATKGDGGVYCSAIDYQKWALKVLSLLGSESKYKKIFQRNRYQFNVNSGISYSMGWFITFDNEGHQCLLHSGESTGFNNIVLLIPERNIVISLFSNRDDLNISPLFNALLTELNIELPAAKGQEIFKVLSSIYAHEYR